jgi:hypothetical protein
MSERQAQVREFGVGVGVAAPQMPFQQQGSCRGRDLLRSRAGHGRAWLSIPTGRLFESDAVRHAAVAGSTAITLSRWRAPKPTAAAASAPSADRHQPGQLGWSREVARHVLCWALAQERFDFRAHGRLLQPFKERASWVETTAGWRLGRTWRFSVEKRLGVTPR